MTELIIWTNQEMNRLRRDMDRLFDQILSDIGIEPSLMQSVPGPYIDIYEKGDILFVSAELPGVNAKDIEISVTENQLTIKAKKKIQVVEQGLFYGKTVKRIISFSKSIRLPYKVKVDRIKANFTKGILIIEMPKSEPERSKGIKIRVR